MYKNIKGAVILGLILLLLLSGCNAASVDLTEENQNNVQAPDANPAESANGAENAPAGRAASLAEVSGDVQKRQTRQEDFNPAGDGDMLYTGGLVQTGEDGRVRLDFSDGTLVRVGPESLFSLEGVEVSDTGMLKQLYLEFGQLWIVLNGGALEVDTPSGVASVRGSYLMVERDAETGDIYATCLEGTCTLELNGEMVTFGAGETAWITNGQAPETGLMTEEEIQAWLDNSPEAQLVLDEVYASIGNLVWNDLNGNSLQDADEPGVEGVTVSLLDAGGEVLDTALTDGDGRYLFEELMPGEYALQFDLEKTMFTLQNFGEDDAKDSDANAAGLTETFYLPPATAYTDVDAGMVYPGHAATCPLTGMPGDAEQMELRPIFISMSMFPASATRPLTGINSAPVVFETIIDQGMTRLQALFYCGYPEKMPEAEGQDNAAFDISGVRSGRVFYSELAQLFGAGLIFAGASSEVYGTIAPYQCGFANNNGGGIGGAGVDIDQLQAIAEDCQHRLGNTDLNVWTFGPAPDGGTPVDKFLMHYNYLNQTRWIYDPEAGGYVRYHNDPASPDDFPVSTDRLTGEATVRQNILLLQVPHHVLNSAGTIIEFDLTDTGGYAWLLRDGTMHKVCWSAIFDDYPTESNRYRPFLLLDCETGEQIDLAYGSTWINVVDPSFWFEEQGEYFVAKQPFLGYGD
jgi:hypothetical protein